MRVFCTRCLLLILLAGCTTQRFAEVPPTPQVSLICLDRNQVENVRRWESEACKRLTNPVVVFCHGAGAFVWTMYPDNGPPIPVEAAAWLLHSIYPGRDILLITCNASGKSLDVPRVWYADTIVWCKPGARWRWSEGKMQYGAGQIWDFRTGK